MALYCLLKHASSCQFLLGMHLKCLELQLCLAIFIKYYLDASVAKSANIQTELQDYLFTNDSKQNLLPVFNYSQAVAVEFGITLIKIKDVVSLCPSLVTGLYENYT